MKCFIIMYSLVAIMSCSNDAKPSKVSVAERRVAIAITKIRLILDFKNDPALKGKEKTVNFLKDDLIAEIESLNSWFSDPSVMISGTKKDSVGLPESEACARIRGKVSEMRSALDGYAEALPSESTLSQRIQIVYELALDCEKQLNMNPRAN